MRLTKEMLKGESKNKLIEIILMQQEQLLSQAKTIRLLEERVARLEKDSQTSSKPPSSDENKPKRNQSLRVKSGKKPGGQKGHRGQTREATIPDEIKRCLPIDKCQGCGNNLKTDESEVVEKRQEVEIPPIKAHVIEYQKIAITCSCGHCNMGQFPEQVKGHVQLGQKLKSFLVYLNVSQLLPYKRLTQLMDDLFNIKICKRSVENSLEEATTKSKPVYDEVKQIVKNSKWVGSDETGNRVEGKRWWEWVWQSEIASYYVINRSRGYKVVRDHFGEDYEGTLCHDCWSAHNNTFAKAGHQQCHAHLQRDLQFLIQAYKNPWAYRFNVFLRASQKARNQIWADGFDPSLRESIIQNYLYRLNTFLYKDGVNNDICRIQKRIIKHQKSILLFMSDPDIPFHNNSSERAIRMTKVKQKISGGFRSERGAQRHAILLSVIETAKKQNMNILLAIQKLFNQSLIFQGC
jgi:transposase